MKNNLFILFLKTFRSLAEVRQIGNPFRKAPLLKEEPGLWEGEMETRVWHMKNVIASALYGGALISADNQVSSQFVSFPWGKRLHPIFSFPYIGKKKKILEKAIYLITPEAKGNYYHWMIDLLPRLLLIKKNNLSDFSERSVILHFPPKSYEAETLDLLNISGENVVRIQPFELVVVKDLVVANYYSNERNFPKWKKTLLKEFKELVTTTNSSETEYKKVYLYRGNQRIRRLIQEEDLVKILRGRGFKIVDPQKLRLVEQIQILKQARIVVSIHGAALTNIVFCEKGSSVIELRSIHNSPEHYSSIARAYELNFDTVSLPPARIKKKRHCANREDLLITAESLKVLMIKIAEHEHSYNRSAEQKLPQQK